jgi:hypothetical protein
LSTLLRLALHLESKINALPFFLHTKLTGLSVYQECGVYSLAVLTRATFRLKDEDAERFEAMSPEDYAAHKHAELMANPLRRYGIMAQETGPTKAELAERIDDIEDLLEEALDPELTREEWSPRSRRSRPWPAARPKKTRPIWRATRNRISMMTGATTRTTKTPAFRR